MSLTRHIALVCLPTSSLFCVCFTGFSLRFVLSSCMISSLKCTSKVLWTMLSFIWKELRNKYPLETIFVIRNCRVLTMLSVVGFIVRNFNGAFKNSNFLQAWTNQRLTHSAFLKPTARWITKAACNQATVWLRKTCCFGPSHPDISRRHH